jgi:hypothetical protein
VGALVVKFGAGGGEVLGSEGGGGAGVLCTGVLFGDAIVRKHKELRGTVLQRVLFFVLIVRWMMFVQVSTSELQTFTVQVNSTTFFCEIRF